MVHEENLPFRKEGLYGIAPDRKWNVGVSPTPVRTSESRAGTGIKSRDFY